MTGWYSSDRRQHLPKNWQSLRLQAKARAGGQCEARDHKGIRCPNPGTECHHLGSRTDHRLDKLQWICAPCHKTETNQQAKREQHARYITARKRTPEPHPGLRPAQPAQKRGGGSPLAP